MRAREHRARTLAFDAAEEIAHGVFAHAESRFAYPAGEFFARRHPRWVVDVADDAAAWLLADRAQVLNKALHLARRHLETAIRHRADRRRRVPLAGPSL